MDIRKMLKNMNAREIKETFSALSGVEIQHVINECCEGIYNGEYPTHMKNDDGIYTREFMRYILMAKHERDFDDNLFDDETGNYNCHNCIDCINCVDCNDCVGLEQATGETGRKVLSNDKTPSWLKNNMKDFGDDGALSRYSLSHS